MNYMKNHKKYFKIFIFLSIIIFFLGMLYGCLTPPNISNLYSNESKFTSIFFNNMKVSLTILILGSITGGVISQIILFANGFIIGKLVVLLYNKNLMFSLFTGLLPHLFIELFGLILFASIAHMPIIFLIYWLKKSNFSFSRNNFLFYLKVSIIAIILIGISAFIESTISIVTY